LFPGCFGTINRSRSEKKIEEKKRENIKSPWLISEEKVEYEKFVIVMFVN